MRKKILITGSEGFIGSNLTPLLDEYQTYHFDLKLGDDIFKYAFENDIQQANIVIHLAAETNVTGSFKHPKKHFVTNTLGTARVVNLCLKYKKRLIYPSTGAVRISDTSPYALSKKMAEDIVTEAGKYIPVTILRFFNIYGKGMNKNSGSIFYQFLKGAKKGEILVYGKGKSERDFINVKDIAQIIKASLGKEWIGQTVEVGTGKTHSIKELANYFAKYSGAKVTFDSSKKEIKWVTADTKKLRKLYKRKLITNLEKDIKEMLNG